MKLPVRTFVLAVLAVSLLTFPLAAAAGHADDPHTPNLHPLGDSFEFGSFLVSPALAQSDLAFQGRLAFEGSYDGFRVVDVSDPEAPAEIADVICTGNQGDVIVWDDILIRTVDRPQRLPNNDLSRACEGVDTDPAGETGFEGLQIFQADSWSTVSADDLVTAVPTDCGAHTATVAPDLTNNRLIVYVSVAGSATFAGPTPYGTTCAATHPRIVAVNVPLDNPAGAAVINNNIPAGTNGCHDVNVHQGVNRLVGACRPSVIAWDISDPVNPVQLYTTTAPGPTTWHTASMTWDGRVLVMGWEPGGGSQPRCQATDPDFNKSIFFFNAANGVLLGKWTLPRPQTAQENCTIHNLNVLPLRDRYVLAHGGYQSGTNVVDFSNILSDPNSAREIAWSDPPPLVPTQLGGAWSSYWYNGFIYESDITTGLRIYNLSDRARAGARKLDHLNPQTQEFVID
jgi:hypothetical protein